MFDDTTVIQAVKYLGSVTSNGPGGTTQPQKVMCSDFKVYALKLNNPFPNFGLRVLPAELMASHIARWIGVRIPDIRLVNVAPEFLKSNPTIKFKLKDNATCTPEPGCCIGSHWIENANAVVPEQIPMTPDNSYILACLFVASNLLCMNDDHARNYNNLLLDPDQSVWVIDWGHPFFLNGCNDWSQARLSPFLNREMVVASELLAFPEVRTHLLDVTQRVSTIPQEVINEAFHRIPDEWRSPRTDGVTEHESESAQAFLFQRAKLLPKLILSCLT